MEINNNGVITETAKRNICLKIVDKGLNRNLLATKAGIPSTSFNRKLDHPEQFTLKDLGSIAQALEIDLTELFKDAA